MLSKENAIRALEYTEQKHRNDKLYTGATDISMLCSDVLRVLENCIEIPEGATYKDVFMAMFPGAIKSNYIKTDPNMGDYVTIYFNDREILIPYDLWNSPYKVVIE